MKNKYKPWIESSIDTGIALAINFPVNVFLLWLCVKMNVGIFNTSLIMTATFTIIAIVRKVVVRNFFKNKLKW